LQSQEADVTDRSFQNVSRDSEAQADSSPVRQNLNPGDEAAPGTPGTGEDICPLCHGQGRIMHTRCPNCGGSGKIVRAIGGA
jgi:hypothetical protein